MRILPEPVVFEWDKGNRDKNLRKHTITDQKTEEPFNNKPLIVFLDRKHSTDKEIRYQALGKTNEKELLFLSFTVRENKVRIISARPMSKKERKKYAQKT